MQTIETRRRVEDVEIGDRFVVEGLTYEVHSFNGSDSAECKNITNPSAQDRTFLRDGQLLAKVRLYALESDRALKPTVVPPVRPEPEKSSKPRRPDPDPYSVRVKGVITYSTQSSASRALAIAEQAHKGQIRKGGQAYFSHCKAVANMLEHLKSAKISAFNFDTALAAAYLHDVLEDTELNSEDLSQMGVDAAIIEVVEAVTRGQDEAYFEFIERVTAASPEARAVKLADILHNILRSM